ncbi:hypothetical protein PRIPAC_71404, partial [Pristionchus pacificus]
SLQMAEPNTSWASYAASGASTAYGAAANTVGPWVSSAASVASNAYSTVSPWATSAATGVYNGASSACDAVRRTVWGGETAEENARNASTAVGVATKNAVGVFTKLNSLGKQPIYGHVSGGTLGWRQLNDAGKGAIFRPTAYNPSFTGLGYASLGGAIAIDSYEMCKAVQKDYSEGSYTNTAVKGATVAGTWAGAIPGATAGATIGGAVIPVAGSFIGGVTGGILGAVYGAWGGEAAAKSLLPSTESEKKKDELTPLPVPNVE